MYNINWTRALWLILALSTFAACEEIPDETTALDSWTFDLKDISGPRLAGSAFVASIQDLELEERESAIHAEIVRGNVPDFMRADPLPIQLSETIGDTFYEVTFYVMPEYLSIGSDNDYILMPMTPILAQRVMDSIGGIFPTRKMVNLIWEASSVKLEPQPIAPSAAMITVSVFVQHNNIVQLSRNALLVDFPLGNLVAGHKKDVILSNRIKTNPGKVVIYGWHYPSGTPIQPLYSGHMNWYADYSHGIRAVLAKCLVNGESMLISDVLHNPLFYQLLSDESGPMEQTRYDTSSSNYP